MITISEILAKLRTGAYGDVPRAQRKPRYGWNKPHDSKRARQRRLRQIVKGQLDVSPEVRGEALQNLIVGKK